MQLTVFVVLAVLAVALAAEWTIDTSTTSGIIVGVGAGSKSSAIAAASSDSQGAEVSVYNNGKWSQHTGVLQAGILLDGAISADGQNCFYTSMYGMYLSKDGGESFSTVPGMGGLSQDAHMFNGGKSYAAVGSFIVPPGGDSQAGSFHGVAVSTDGEGQEWSISEIDNEHYPRYGDFPSDKTWYITAGMWNTTDDEIKVSTAPHLEHVHLSSRMKAGKSDGKKTINMLNKGLKSDTNDGWYGAIYKTTDGGASWSQVYHTPSDETWYFNKISCPTVDTCVAVGEGNDASGAPYVVALSSQDGGKTWAKTFESSNQYMSVMSVLMTSPTQGFIAPVGPGASRGGIAADFMLTTDGGLTWSASQSLDNCYAIDADGADGFALAACLNSSGSAGSIAMYQ